MRLTIKMALLAVLLFTGTLLIGQSQRVSVSNENKDMKLLVNNKPFMINGMNWDYFPIGTNYFYSLWNQPDAIIQAALDEEMSLLANIGVNSIRVYWGMPKKWITYIYEKYGIYTMINHSFGRYGVTVDGVNYPNTDYSNPKIRAYLLNEAKKLAEDYKGTPGLLLYLLGNENNYGLFWEGAETEDIPMEDRKSTKKAYPLYSLFNEAAQMIKASDRDHPVAICNGDLLFLDIIAKECQDVDILGTNVYRGISFDNLFDRVKKEYGRPVLFTEFGSDAFNTQSGEEDQRSQAMFVTGNWQEIYENAAGMGKAGNAIGGYTFQFSDGWWKFGQTKFLDVHDNNASWSNGGYFNDYKAGENNMNEEWFGLCAKGPSNAQGLYKLYPRAAYYALKEVHKFDPYLTGVGQAQIKNHFAAINLTDAELRARGDKAALTTSKINLSRFTAELSTYNTGGSLITTPKNPVPGSGLYPNQQGFDHTESFYIGVEAQPVSNMKASVEVNLLANVAQNPIDQIFYENRGRPVRIAANNGSTTLFDNNRIQVYRASYTWDHKMFSLNGFYRTGHYHWGYEGDFFGIYREANYGPNIDIYNGIAPFGFEVEGKKKFAGLKAAFGPQLWWGSNPAVLLKYTKELARFKVTGVFHEDLEQLGNTESSFAIPQPKTRRLSLHATRNFGKLGVDLGGIWAGQPLNGRSFQLVREQGGVNNVYEDVIKSSDNWGGKIKFTLQAGKFNWYAQSAVQGLVANGGSDQTQTITGWRLKDSGSGNQYNVLSGFAYRLGSFEIAPNFLYQRPIEGPVPGGVAAPGRPRNIISDPFVVRANRETVAGELLFTYDPTPASWFYEWDNDRAENSAFSISAGIVYRHQPTTMDAAIGIFPDGRTTFAFPAATPAQDLWEVNTRIVSKTSRDYGFIANMYAGNAQANGSDTRVIKRIGADIRAIYKKMKVQTFLKFNDWGPYDYHRDFNLTFPMQCMLDVSLTAGKTDWIPLPGSRIGIRTSYRTLDKYSPRYSPVQTLDPAGNPVPDPNAIGFDHGKEWEIRTYVHINISK